MSNIREVIKRLEEATEGSRDLTADVYEALGYSVIRRRGSPRGVAWRFFKDGRWMAMSDFTESLDAALMLVPEGMGWQIVCPNPPHAAAIIHLNDAEGGTVEIGAETAPVALCIVCLLARFPEARP